MKHIVLKLLLLFSIAPVVGQNLTKQDKGRIMGDFHFSKDSVMLRWSPDNARLWQLGNQYGYIVEKVLLEKNGKNVNQNSQVLTSKPLKPMPLDKWEKLFNKIERSAIVAQAIYGETFSVTQKSKGSEVGRAIQENEEKTQRFGFTALLADQYYEVASAAALGFTDKNTKTDEVYGYKIYCPVPAKLNIALDTAYIIASFKNQEPVTAPRGMAGVFGDRTVRLEWDNNNEPNYFSGYFIERSLDGKNFKTINIEPIVHFESDADAGKVFNKKIIKNDSLPANDVTYHYRVRGLTSFGELSPPTKVITGKGRKLLTETPVISTVGVQKTDGKVQINWTFPPEKNKQIKHFQIRRSANLPNGVIPADSILERVSVVTRRFIDSKPIPTAYYQVAAIGLQEEELLSYATSMELPDSIPPATPSGLTGKIDTLGIVQLHWDKNTERDFLGYRVFRSELSNGTFVQITHNPNLTDTYTDTVNIKTTTKYVYYKLVAIDTRGNPSDFSETIRLKRPDIYPPVSPYFKNFKVAIGEVTLEWANSPSEDLDSTWLYRRKRGTASWQLLTAFSKKSVSSFTDTTDNTRTEYEYRLSASDESGKLSVDDKKYLVIQWLESKIKAAPSLTLEKQNNAIVLHWNKLSKIKKTLIFRKTNSTSAALFKTVWGANINSFEDKAIVKGQEYGYMVKLIFEDNTESFFSKEVTLIYE